MLLCLFLKFYLLLVFHNLLLPFFQSIHCFPMMAIQFHCPYNDYFLHLLQKPDMSHPLGPFLPPISHSISPLVEVLPISLPSVSGAKLVLCINSNGVFIACRLAGDTTSESILASAFSDYSWHHLSGWGPQGATSGTEIRL